MILRMPRILKTAHNQPR